MDTLQFGSGLSHHKPDFPESPCLVQRLAREQESGNPPRLNELDKVRKHKTRYIRGAFKIYT